MELTSEMRKARNAYMRAWRAKNREHTRNYGKAWRQAHPEKIKEYQDRYWQRKAEELTDKLIKKVSEEHDCNE